MKLLNSARRIRNATGKSISRQLIEALSLRLSHNWVGLSEYFEYGIWDPQLTDLQRREFIGWRRSSELDRLLNDDYSRILANDKLINYSILTTQKFPIPRPIATYSTDRRTIADELTLHSKEDVSAFLATATFPLFVKPISAGYGRGVMGVSGLVDGRVSLLNGKSIGFDEFFAPFLFLPFKGMLLQECIEAHPAIKELTGSSAICCVRMICFVISSGPVIHTAFLKIVTGSNMLDNFSHGDYGNCLGSVDLATGTITHVIARVGPGGSIERHPTTNKLMIGFTLPDWIRAQELVKRATSHFPGLRIQNWDVAFTPTGPVLVELNTESELAVPQAINHRGFMDNRLKEILRDAAEYDEKLQQAVKSANRTLTFFEQ